MTTAFTDLVGCDLALQQAGVGPVATEDLAAAVTAAGALGSIGAAAVPPEHLDAMLRDIAARTDGPVCVNFLMPFLDRAAVEVAARQARVVEFFYGDPDADLVAMARAAGALVSWQIGSVDEAVAAVRAGANLVIAQGVEAGGHVRGTTPLAELLPAVRSAVDVPVLAAGGIGSRDDVRRIMAAGADGVRIGTRFVAADESQAHPAYVQQLIEATSEDTVLTEKFGLEWPNAPHRVLRSSIERAENAPNEQLGERTFGGWTMPIARFSSMLPTRDTTGDVLAMALYAGMSVGQVSERRPAKSIVHELMDPT